MESPHSDATLGWSFGLLHGCRIPATMPDTMRNFLDQIVAYRCGAVAILLVAAFLEAYGDSCFQSGLHRSSGGTRFFAFLVGAVSLTSYGLVLNVPRWNFGRLLGVYVVLFFLCAQVIAKVKFGQTPSIPLIAGGVLITAGGVIVTAFGT